MVLVQTDKTGPADRDIVKRIPDGVGAALDDQAQEQRQKVGAQPLRRDKLLQHVPERDLHAVLAHRAVVHQQEVYVVLVQADEMGPTDRHIYS